MTRLVKKFLVKVGKVFNLDDLEGRKSFFNSWDLGVRAGEEKL